MRGSIISAALGVLILAAPAQAQQPTIPAGFTAYRISGPGINAPPLPFRIEGDRIVAPQGGMITVTDGARGVNDVKVSEDGRWLVATREGAALGSAGGGLAACTTCGSRRGWRTCRT